MSEKLLKNFILEEMQFIKGQVVFDYDDEADGVYLIIDGQFELVTKVDIEPS